MTLIDTPAKRCHTVVAWAVRDGKVLVILHKKLGVWLAPGGHVEEDELPHRAAEREFLEETGIVGKVVSAYPTFPRINSEALPLPFTANLHEMNKPRAGGFCEQHYVYSFLIEIVDESGYGHQVEESDGIGWYTLPELEGMKTYPDILAEARMALSLSPQN